MTVNSENITYLYDANDNRMYKNVDTTLEEYYLKDLGVLDMKTGNWSYYASGTERFLRIEPDSVHQPKYNASIDSISISNGERFFYETDHLGNTRIVFSPRDQYFKYIHFASDFYPYGKILRQFVSTPEKYQLTGKQRDEETELDYFGARYYDSGLGKFLAIDPLATKYPGFSDYAYCLGNPIKFVDPTGMAVEDWFLSKKTGNLIYARGKSELTQGDLDKIGSPYDVSDYERVGSDDMFGKELPITLPGWTKGVNQLDRDYNVVDAHSTEILMDYLGFVKAKTQTIKETTYTDVSVEDFNFKITTTIPTKQILSSQISYVKPQFLNTKTTRFIKEENLIKGVLSVNNKIYDQIIPYNSSVKHQTESNDVWKEIVNHFAEKLIPTVSKFFKNKD